MGYSREDRIRTLAQSLAERAGNPPGRDLEFWLQAERLHDEDCQGDEPRSPRQTYANFMQRFFAAWDRGDWPGDARASYQGGETMGNRFLRMVHDDERLLSTLVARTGAADRQLFDVSLLTETGEIEEMSKRSLLMTDTALLGSSSPTFTDFLRLDTSVDDYLSMIQGERYGANLSHEFLTPWLEAMRPNLERGEIFLLPKTGREEYCQGFSGTPWTERHIFDAVVRSGRVKTFFDGDVSRQAFIRFIAEVPIPTVNDVGLQTFSTVYNEDIDALNALKEVLRERFLDLEMAKVAENAETSFLKIGNRIARESRLAANDIRSVAKRGAVQAAGVALGTGLAVLTAVNTAMLPDLTPLISGAGGLAALYKLVDARLENKSRLEANPYLFLWLLKKEAMAA